MKEDHAVGVTGGITDFNFPLMPFCMIVLRTGSLPSSIHGCMTSKVAPSRPMTTTLLLISSSVMLED
jgi:hypothetical protein